jgi:hypothetical protein
MSHLDHLKSHIISAIMNIKQDVEEDWPLQIFDHQGRPHEILLKPGEMIWWVPLMRPLMVLMPGTSRPAWPTDD